jgi:hypothetical protein
MKFKFEVQVRDITSKASSTRLKVLEILVGLLLQDPNPEELPNQHFEPPERGPESG